MSETPTAEQQAEWESWLASRPPAVVEKARRYPPWVLYRMTPTNQLAQITSYSEGDDGSCETCCVTAWQEFIPIPVGVFGVPFSDLVPA